MRCYVHSYIVDFTLENKCHHISTLEHIVTHKCICIIFVSDLIGSKYFSGKQCSPDIIFIPSPPGGFAVFAKQSQLFFGLNVVHEIQSSEWSPPPVKCCMSKSRAEFVCRFSSALHALLFILHCLHLHLYLLPGFLGLLWPCRRWGIINHLGFCSFFVAMQFFIHRSALSEGTG